MTRVDGDRQRDKGEGRREIQKREMSVENKRVILRERGSMEREI